MNVLGPWLFYSFAVFVVYSPQFVRSFMASAIGWLWYDVFKIRRKVILENIGRVFPDMSEDERIALGRKNLRYLGGSFLTYFQLPFLNKKRLAQQFVFRGVEHVERARAKGKGVCILTLHLGNGDYAIGGLSVYGFPIYLIGKEMSVGWLNTLLLKIRAKLGTVFIAPRRTSIVILKALKDEGMVIFVHDQYTGKPIGCESMFFGHKTGTAMGLAILADRAGAPVVPCHTYVDENGKNVVAFGPEIPYEKIEGPPEATIHHMTQVYSNHLEPLILAHPEQWMWIHRRWKNFHD